MDQARELVGFFFGADDAPAPPPNLRSFADLYVALTGDVYFRGVFDGGRVQFAGATTSTLPNLAVDAMNRVIVQQFQALGHYRWYERVAVVAPNDLPSARHEVADAGRRGRPAGGGRGRGWTPNWTWPTPRKRPTL